MVLATRRRTRVVLALLALVAAAALVDGVRLWRTAQNNALIASRATIAEAPGQPPELRFAQAAAFAASKPVKDYVQLVLTDVEMPEVDGYMLAKQIKSDARFSGIPIVMHSSLSGVSNRKLGMSVGVDEYVAKFAPDKLAQTLSRMLA